MKKSENQEFYVKFFIICTIIIIIAILWFIFMKQLLLLMDIKTYDEIRTLLMAGSWLSFFGASFIQNCIIIKKTQSSSLNILFKVISIFCIVAAAINLILGLSQGNKCKLFLESSLYERFECENNAMIYFWINLLYILVFSLCMKKLKTVKTKKNR